VPTIKNKKVHGFPWAFFFDMYFISGERLSNQLPSRVVLNDKVKKRPKCRLFLSFEAMSRFFGIWPDRRSGFKLIFVHASGRFIIDIRFPGCLLS
jgi:hypothetical protein